MIAYYLYPLAEGEDMRCRLPFVQLLRAPGWPSLIITAHPRSDKAASDDRRGPVPSIVVCVRRTRHYRGMLVTPRADLRTCGPLRSGQRSRKGGPDGSANLIRGKLRLTDPTAQGGEVEIWGGPSIRSS